MDPSPLDTQDSRTRSGYSSPAQEATTCRRSIPILLLFPTLLLLYHHHHLHHYHLPHHLLLHSLPTRRYYHSHSHSHSHYHHPHQHNKTTDNPPSNSQQPTRSPRNPRYPRKADSTRQDHHHPPRESQSRCRGTRQGRSIPRGGDGSRRRVRRARL